jgi:glycosyltransferase involved in cell wall biosynthesis
MITVEILGKFYDNHSLSIINRRLASELKNYNSQIDLFITPLDTYSASHKLHKNDVKLLKNLESNSGKEPDIQIRHTYPPIWRHPVSKKTKIIYIQPWEYSKIPFEWQYKWENFADAVITPSMWTGDKYLDAGLNPERLYVVPNGYDPDIFNFEPEESKFFDAKKFTFLFVGNHQNRKGLDILLNVWKDAFVKADNVQLFIKDTPQIYGYSNLLSQIMHLQYHTDCGKITYNGDLLSEQEMANIYKNSKVVVHPYRGEGFGMHVQESVACGAFPIITSQGPTEEFIPQEIGFRINTNKRIVDLTSPEIFAVKPGDCLTNMGGHGWILEPEAEHLKFNMRLIYAHHERKKFFDKVKEYENPNTWNNVGKKYLDVITKVHNGGSTMPRREY